MHAQDSATERFRPTEPSFDPLPQEINSPAAKLLYLYLSAVGPATAEELSRMLQVRRLTVYPILETLISSGLISRHDQTYRRCSR